MKYKSKEFQYIVELVDIINRHKVKQINVITNPNSSLTSDRYWQFYNEMTKENFKSDKDAMEFFNLQNNSKSYQKLRKGVEKRLINTLFFMDLSDNNFDNYAKIVYQIKKEFLAFQIIYGRGGRTLAINMGKSILRVAIKYQLTEIIIETAAFLKDYFSRDLDNHSKYDEYNSLMWKHHSIYQSELKASEYYERFIMAHLANKTSLRKNHKQLTAFIDELSAIPESLRSEKFYRFYLSLKIFVPMSQYKWKDTIKAANEGICYYQQHPLFPSRIISSFLLQKIAAEIMDFQFKKVKTDITQAEKYIATNSKAWFRLKELETLSYCFNSKYTDAWNLIKSIIRNKRFLSLTQANKEIWYIFNAYISLIQLLGKINLSPREKGSLKQFRLSKFLNEVPTFSKDKRGMNISILIVQILILLYEQKYDKLDNKIDSFMKYKRRRLEDISLRTGYFIKIIECLRRGNYQKDKFIKKATPYYDKMIQIEMNISNQSLEFEVIPYEKLWEYIIEILSSH